LSHNQKNGGHFVNVKVRHSKTSKCPYERFFFADDVPWNRGKRFVAFSLSVFERCNEDCVAKIFVEFFEMIETENFTVEFVQESFNLKTPILTYPEFDLHQTALLKY
jgi:hypothetical protein